LIPGENALDSEQTRKEFDSIEREMVTLGKVPASKDTEKRLQELSFCFRTSPKFMATGDLPTTPPW
jgi:hypothetical protein